MNRDKLVTLDVEVYPNYLLVMFRKISTGDVIYFEKFNGSDLNKTNIFHILKKYCVVTFNGNKYDKLIVEAALAGFTNEGIYKLSCSIIEDNLQPWQVRKQTGIQAVDFDHIDLLEVAPLKASLKIYAGRIHAPRLKDLPIPPETEIQEKDLPVMREYCGIDNENTALLYINLEPEIDLRRNMSKEYNVDLRSKSDAQIAEAVIKQELESKYGLKAKRPKIESGTKFHYKAPDNLVFKSDLLKDVLRQYTTIPIGVGKSGHAELAFDNGKGKLQIHIGDTKYTLGVGGIHSCEKSKRYVSGEYIIRDYDVAAFYPNIILNNELYPKHLGRAFLSIYESIVQRRIKAKKAGDKVTNESLKITINGSFGKLGSKWSCLYSPDLMAQVTITGQLSLLMLIERLEDQCISVISANTDGIVVKMKPEQSDLANSIIEDWEFDTNYEMEATDYLSINSRDINNYIAVKDKKPKPNTDYNDSDYGIKGKGAYADQRDHYYRFRSNPTCDICTEAVKIFLKQQIPVQETIKSCKDITKFLTLRTVNGGAVKDGELIGKAIRWYYGEDELDAIFYSTNGNKVPKSDGGVPLMNIPDEFPSDVDYEWYITESKRILKDIGYKAK